MPGRELGSRPRTGAAFRVLTADLHEMSNGWFRRACGAWPCHLLGVHWMPVFEVLEHHGLEVNLVNARHTKNLPGRKSDVQESVNGC
jgi:transposase